MPTLYRDRDDDLWCFGDGGSWVLYNDEGSLTWSRGPMEQAEAERDFGPLVELPAPPDGAL